MAMTLLELTQKVLNKLEGDEVDTIDETTESLLFANEIIDCFLTMHSQSNEAWSKDRFLLTDKSKYELTIPSNVQYADSIKYNGIKLIKLSIDEFEDLLLKRKDTNNYNSEGYGTSKDPVYFTTYNEVDIVVEGINEAVEANVTGTNTNCYGKVIPTALVEDSYIPSPLPPSFFSALLSKATANCLNRFREKSAKYDREEEMKINSRMNRSSKVDINNNNMEDFNDWGF